jgi:hypothetical protein
MSAPVRRAGSALTTTVTVDDLTCEHPDCTARATLCHETEDGTERWYCADHYADEGKA